MKPRIKKLIAVVFFVLPIAILFSKGIPEKQSEDLMQHIGPSKGLVTSGEATPAVTDGYYQFAHNLLQSTSERQHENIMISPLSVYLALGMSANGAQVETKAAMVKVLSPKASLEDLNKNVAFWIDALSDTEKNTIVEIANSIWVQHDYHVAQKFLQINADYFKATAKSIDFNDQEAAKTINSWIAKSTKDKIDSIIDRTSADMLVMLINASYFKSDWEEPFEVKRTREQIFHAQSEDIMRPFMHTIRSMQYIDFNQAQGIMMPYEGRRYWFAALIPQEGLSIRSWFEHQDPRDLFSVLNGKHSIVSAEVDLAIPTFTSTYEVSLITDLASMGMKIAFLPDQADFSLMSEAGTKDLFISDVKHKSFIQVDEVGTEAAAVTSVVMKATAMAPQEIKRIVFDRPFLYAIIDRTTELPLFIGILDKPVAP